VRDFIGGSQLRRSTRNGSQEISWSERRRVAERSVARRSRVEPGERCAALAARWRVRESERDCGGLSPLPPAAVAPHAAASRSVRSIPTSCSCEGERDHEAALGRAARCGWSAPTAAFGCSWLT
jgi:hypothetical protein